MLYLLVALVSAVLVGLGWRLGRLYRRVEWLAELAGVDDVTGALTRKFGMARIRESLREGHSGGLIFVDLDDFGLINKHLGWLAGDARLRDVVERLQQHARRERDLVVRYGGDEFVVWLERMDPLRFSQLSRTIRGQLAEVASLGAVHMVDPDLGGSHDLKRLLSIAQSRAMAAKSTRPRPPSDSLRTLEVSGCIPSHVRVDQAGPHRVAGVCP